MTEPLDDILTRIDADLLFYASINEQIRQHYADEDEMAYLVWGAPVCDKINQIVGELTARRERAVYLQEHVDEFRSPEMPDHGIVVPPPQN